ncbi:MAG: conjugal transfer protein TraR [Bacteroidota bacterium]|nr:conjugal transfer protein TraR [Bacteroidota bacterium]
MAKAKSKTSTKKPASDKKLIKKNKVKAKAIKKEVVSDKPGKTVIAKVEKRLTSVKAELPIEKKLKRFKPNKKERYSVTELKHFRNIILLERKAILESAKANMDALVDKDSGEYKGDNLTYSSHMAEQGTDEMEREKNYLFVQRDEKYLGYLQDALMRIDQGTYGICIDCRDNPKNLCRTCPLIVKERLELVPITQHCIECKNLRG